MKKGAFYTNEYRNVFNEIGIDDSQVKLRLEKCWEEAFYGDENTKFYYPVGDDMGYIMDTGNNDARTEGMSYGMMMCVQMDKKDEFDRIWRWTKKYMYMDQGPCSGYFAWSCSTSGVKNAHGPASDGEEFFALALFFASHRWGDGPAPLNYSEQAREILRMCIHKGDKFPGPSMWNIENKLIKFVPGLEFTDPSYHLPHFYELFALWADEEDRQFWADAAKASREYLHLACHPETGLSPEYSEYDGTPHKAEWDYGHHHFYSDSYRTIANIGLDTEWFAKDPWQVEIANKYQAFFENIKPEDYTIYVIDGTPVDEKALHPVGLQATNAMASLAADKPVALEYVKIFWEMPLRTGERRYYDNCLYLFAMLALSGNYRIWMPKK